MSWAERLEKKISEIPPRRQCLKCLKPKNTPLDTLDTSAHRVFQKNKSEVAKRHAYHFRLHNDEGGGTVLTDESNLEKARDSLAARYGDRLALVTKA